MCPIDTRNGESITEFTIRRIKAEIIEECAKRIDQMRVDSDACAHADSVLSGYMKRGYENGLRDAANLLREIASA